MYKLIQILLFSCRLIDGVTITLSDEHMWLVPYTENGNHVLTIELGRTVEMIGLRFWNYNKSIEDTYRGVSYQGLGCEMGVSPYRLGVGEGQGNKLKYPSSMLTIMNGLRVEKEVKRWYPKQLQMISKRQCCHVVLKYLYPSNGYFYPKYKDSKIF